MLTAIAKRDIKIHFTVSAGKKASWFFLPNAGLTRHIRAVIANSNLARLTNAIGRPTAAEIVQMTASLACESFNCKIIAFLNNSKNLIMCHGS